MSLTGTDVGVGQEANRNFGTIMKLSSGMEESVPVSTSLLVESLNRIVISEYESLKFWLH